MIALVRTTAQTLYSDHNCLLTCPQLALPFLLIIGLFSTQTGWVPITPSPWLLVLSFAISYMVVGFIWCFGDVLVQCSEKIRNCAVAMGAEYIRKGDNGAFENA